MLDNMSTNDKILAAFVGLVLLAGMVESAATLIMLLTLAGVVYFAREFNKDQKPNDDVDVQVYERRMPRRERQPNVDQVYPHALQAVRSAGLNPDNVPVLPVDIGIISYHGDEDPKIHRTWPIADNCDYRQPFVQLRIPGVASGKVRFELSDNTGQAVFIHEDNYQLKRGRNLIVPSSRLPIHDEREIDGKWQLLIKGDNVLLAQYDFAWEEAKNNNIQRHLGEDGEINSEMKAILVENRLQKMSLDDLLAHQDEEADMDEARSH